MKDHLVRIVSRDGSLRAAAATTTALAEAICSRQGTDATAAVALGRLVTGTALLGSLLKGDQRLALMIEGNGPLQKLQAETDADGHVRGSIRVPVADLPLREGRFDVAGAIGRAGFLNVVKDLGLKEPYRGMVQLYTSEVAEDLAYYLTTSEQVPSSVGLGVYIEADGTISSAGGFLVQSLPNACEETLTQLEKRLTDLPPLTTLLRQGLAPVQILETLFEGIPFDILAQTDLEFRCNCRREQVRQVLRSLGREELRELSEREEATTVTCEFCKEVYAFDGKELQELLDA